MNNQLVNIKASNAITLLTVCILSMSLIGCANDNSDLKKFMQEVKASEPGPIEPIPKLKPLPKFLFPSDVSRRNPFKQIVQQKEDDKLAPDQNRKKEALEAFPLDALKLVGILKQAHVVWALIKQPDDKINFVKVGNYIGKNYGRILVIKPDFIKIEEVTKDSGKWEKHITTLNLNVGK